jgi:signal transduction histidine kinase
LLDMPEDAANPIGIEAAGAVIGGLVGVGFLVLAALGLLCAASLVVRFRRARGEERKQIEWLAYGGVLLAVYLLLTTLGEWTRVPLLVDSFLMTALSVIAFTSIPLAVGVALLRYRLYEIDVVINKTVVVAVLATFVTAVYLAIVVGIGTAIGTRGEPNLVLSIAATAVIALAFQPLRERARRLADHVVYGKRATPYEVLSDFSERMASAYSTEDVLPRMARILGEGTGATRTEVWLRVGGRLQPAASWPEGGEPKTTTIPILEGELPEFPDATRSVPVRHQSELLGALTLTKPSSEPVSPAEEKLLADLASQAGLMLRNVRLTAELQARLVELRASRQRLVAAQDEERRKIERNIHDGAQQQLVALAVKLRLAENVAKREEAAKTGEMLGDLQVDTTDALETLRDLARGIYPPLLADKGLAAALEAQAHKGTIPTAVHAHGIDRYPMEIEAAVYFCSLEALQNVGKYAKASTATIRVAEEDGHLTFEVADDGLGFDPGATGRGTGLQGMSDRLDAIDGTLEVRSAPGRGTRVTGRVRLP